MTIGPEAGGIAVRPAGGAWAPALVAGAYRGLSATWRYRFDGREILDGALAEGPAILAFWHGEQMAMVRAHAGMGFLGMASRSRDGELLARVVARFGYEVVRGSSSRGGSRALRESIRRVDRDGRSPALALDGPRGPYHHVHPGAVVLSAATGRPIVFGVSLARPSLRMRSWDEFEVPAPFARVHVAYGRMEAPEFRREVLDRSCRDLRRRMDELTRHLYRVAAVVPSARAQKS